MLQDGPLTPPERSQKAQGAPRMPKGGAKGGPTHPKGSPKDPQRTPKAPPKDIKGPPKAPFLHSSAAPVPTRKSFFTFCNIYRKQPSHGGLGRPKWNHGRDEWTPKEEQRGSRTNHKPNRKKNGRGNQQVSPKKLRPPLSGTTLDRSFSRRYALAQAGWSFLQNHREQTGSPKMTFTQSGSRQNGPPAGQMGAPKAPKGHPWKQQEGRSSVQK